MLDPQTFAGIAPAGFQAIADKVKAETGVTVEGNSGHASAKGFELGWQYDPEKETLVIQCLSKPFLIPASVVQAKIRQLVEG